MSYGEFKELTYYVKVSRTSRWVSRRRPGSYRSYTYATKEFMDVRILKNLPPEDKRKWNDYYFPIKLKVPMFYEHEPIETSVPPLSEGEAALELLANPEEV